MSALNSVYIVFIRGSLNTTKGNTLQFILSNRWALSWPPVLLLFFFFIINMSTIINTSLVSFSGACSAGTKNQMFISKQPWEKERKYSVKDHLGAFRSCWYQLLSLLEFWPFLLLCCMQCSATSCFVFHQDKITKSEFAMRCERTAVEIMSGFRLQYAVSVSYYLCTRGDTFFWPSIVFKTVFLIFPTYTFIV